MIYMISYMYDIMERFIFLVTKFIWQIIWQMIGWFISMWYIYMITYLYDTIEINIVNTRFIYYIIWQVISWFWWRRISFYWYISTILTLVPQSYQFCRRDYFLRNMIDEGCRHGLIALHIGAWEKWLKFYRWLYPKKNVNKSTLIQI